MTSALAVIGLTYDAVDVQTEDLSIFLEMPGGIMAVGPGVRGKDTTVPGRAGRIARNRIADTWRIPLAGLVFGVGETESETRTSFASLRSTMGTLFDPTRAPAALVATLEDGAIWTIQARPMPMPLWGQMAPALATVSYELEAVEGWVLVGP